MKKVYDSIKTTNGKQVKVYYDRDWEQYEVRFYVDGVWLDGSTYYTDDKVDAINTARHVMTEEVRHMLQFG